MFNQSTLVFVNSEYLEFVRSIDYRVLLVVFGLLLVSRFTRALGLWALGRRYSVRGSAILSLVPFGSYFLNIRLARSIGGSGVGVRFLFRLMSLLYLGGIALSLFGGTTALITAGIILAIVPYLLSISYWSGFCEGITGKETLLWYIPIVGGMAMMVSSISSSKHDVYMKPVNLGTLFKKSEEAEIAI